MNFLVNAIAPLDSQIQVIPFELEVLFLFILNYLSFCFVYEIA